MSDDPTVALLQYVAASAVPAGDWQPDADAVLRRGRHLRARRAAAVVVAGALAAVVAVGVPAVLTGRTSEVPAGKVAGEQAPRPAGEGQVASFSLDPGLQAVNVPQEGTAGTLTARGVAGLDVTITGTATGALVVADGSSRGIGTASDLAITWTPGDRLADYSADQPYPTTQPVLASSPDGIEMYVLSGSLPSWQRDPVALLVSRTGWTSADGTSYTVVELPTFRAPTDDGRLLYLVSSSGESAQRMLEGAPFVAFVGADGDVFVPGCEGLTTSACSARLLVPLSTLTAGPVAHFGEVGPVPTAPAGQPSPASPTNGTASAPTAPTPPPTTGTPVAVQLAPDVLAAAGPVPGDGVMLTVGQFGGTLVRIARDGSDTDSMVGLSVISAEGGMGAEPLTKGTLGPWATVVYSAEQIFAGTPDERWFAFGTTPPDLAGVRVFYYSPAGIRLADGSAVDVVELPTFTMPAMADNPIEVGRPWFLVGFSGDAIDAVRDASGHFAGGVVFAGPDGVIRDPACGDTECTGPDRAAAYGAIRHLLATEPAVPTVS